MSVTITHTLPDGARIVVPDSLNLITPYVLLEQQDWFEDEIKFVRRLLKPGQKVIDIGANYGVYTLSMAQAVGAAGRVWAFEPASSTAKLLAEGIKSNDFSHVVLEQSALSSVCGTAQLSLNEDSELNALARGKSSAGTSETVPLVTLDQCLERYDWQDIAFMKIDAEGEEANILKGGERFFAEQSPLVQYEIKSGEGLSLKLVQDFAELGYASYRLVPGLGVLIPFDAESPPDAYLLNLFCCKPDRCKKLAGDGLLIDPSAYSAATADPKSKSVPGVANKSGNAYGWRDTIAKLPYGIQLASVWEQRMVAGGNVELDEALTFYAISRNVSLSAGERFAALEASFKLFNLLCNREPSYLRLASMARVARDYGDRGLAVNALQQLSNTILRSKQVSLTEPFLAPSERFDLLAPTRENIGSWVLAGVLEAVELLGAFSSFYPGLLSRQRLEMIQALGFGDAQMKRRLDLLRKRFESGAA